MVKSVFEGTEYIKGWKESIKSIEDKLTALRAQSNAANYAVSRQHRQRIERKTDLIHNDVRQSGMQTRTMLNEMLSMMNDYDRKQSKRERRIIAELTRVREKNVYLHAEIEILRSRSPSPNALILMQQQDELSTPHLDDRELQDLLQVEYKDTDLRFIVGRKAHLLTEELSRAEQLVNDRKYRAWFMSLQSEKLLILWNQRQPRTHAGISPISVFCASLEPTFNSHNRFICITWFCGLHSKHGNDEARAMLAGLIVQLCQQHHFDFGREYDDTDKSLVEERDPGELFHLFYRLIRSLPMETTVIILVDEAYVYERNGFQDGLNIFNELLQLVTNAAIQSVIKLLFTSTRKVEFLNEAFKQGGLTLHVETAAHQRGGPSQRRMERQMRLDSDQGRARETVREKEQEYYGSDGF